MFAEKKYIELSERQILSDFEVIELLSDPVIRDAIIQLKMDVLISGWVVKGSSDAVALFCRHILSRVWVELVMTLLNAIAKGTQICEVTWDIEDVKVLGKSYPASVVPKNFYMLPKRSTKFLWDEEKREIVGVRFFKKDGTHVDLLNEKVVWYAFNVNERSWPYGVPLLQNIKPLNEMFSDAIDLLGAYIENLTLPPIIGYAPHGEINDAATGETLDGLEYMARRLSELRSSGICVLPTDLTPEGQPRWRVDFQTGATPSGSVEIARILEILRDFKKEAIYSTKENQPTMSVGELPIGLPGYILRELLDHLNKRIVKHLVYLNWGPEEWAYIEPADQAADIGLVRDIVRSTIQFSDQDRQRILKMLDWYSLLQMFGLPLAMEEKEEPVVEQTMQPGLGLGLGGLGGFGGLGGVQLPQTLGGLETQIPPAELPPVEPAGNEVEDIMRKVLGRETTGG